MIVVLGSSNTDLIINCTRLPKRGETVMGEFLTADGGKGANQAVAVCRLKHEVHMLGCTSQDQYGARTRDHLQAEGVFIEQMRMDPSAGPGIALILVDLNGENMIASALGANACYRPEDVRSSAAIIRQADILLCDFAMPIEVIEAAIEIAHQGQTKVVLTPSPARPLPNSFLQTIDIILPNETEAEILTGMPVDTLEQAEQAGRYLLECGARTVILTLGSRGAMLCAPSKTFYAAPYSVTAVDATAAGDAFTGGLAVAIAEGYTIEESMRFANAVGALAVTRRGAQPSLPCRDEVEKFIAQHR